MTGKGVLLAGALLGGLALGGCLDPAGGGLESDPPGRVMDLVPMARPPVADVPVPIGFALDEESSRNYTVAGGRVVDHMYEGSADPFAVGRFYRRHMPASGWMLTSDLFSQGQTVLDFANAPERCRIRVWRQPGLFPTTRVQVQLWSNGHAAPEAAGPTTQRQSSSR